MCWCGQTRHHRSFFQLQPPQAEEMCSASPMQRTAVKPYTAECGHTYCGSFVDLLARLVMPSFLCVARDEESDNQSCHQLISTSELTRDWALEKTINQKLVSCTNHGCQETMKLKALSKHLATACDFEDIECPNCKKKFERRLMGQHQQSCKSRACEFSSFGCEHVTESADAVGSASTSKVQEHGVGVHIALMYQSLAAISAVAAFSARTLDAAMTRHSKVLASESQACSNVYVHVCTYVYVYTYVHVCMYTYTYTLTCVCHVL